MDAWVALGGVVLGFVLAAGWQVWRDRANAASQRKLLTGALAAELRGFKAVFPKSHQEAIGWAAEQSYFPVYDSAGVHLHLLGSDVLTRVAECYFSMRRALDTLAAGDKLTSGALLLPPSQRGSGDHKATSARERAVAGGQEAFAVIEQVLPELDRIAGSGEADC